MTTAIVQVDDKGLKQRKEWRLEVDLKVLFNHLRSTRNAFPELDMWKELLALMATPVVQEDTTDEIRSNEELVKQNLATVIVNWVKVEYLQRKWRERRQNRSFWTFFGFVWAWYVNFNLSLMELSSFCCNVHFRPSKLGLGSTLLCFSFSAAILNALKKGLSKLWLKKSFFDKIYWNGDRCLRQENSDQRDEVGKSDWLITSWWKDRLGDIPFKVPKFRRAYNPIRNYYLIFWVSIKM